MQDLEFTIESGKLWMLQTRNGKRTGKAAVRIAVDLANEGLITQDGGGRRASIRRRSTSCCIRRSIRRPSARSIATGLPASPGAASGEIVFTPDEAESAKKAGRKVILVRVETIARGHPRHARRRGHPDRARRHDRHAAVVARGMGKPCVAGAGAIRVDDAAKTLTVGGRDAQAGRRSSRSTARPARCLSGEVADARSPSCRASSRP